MCPRLLWVFAYVFLCLFCEYFWGWHYGRVWNGGTSSMTEGEASRFRAEIPAEELSLSVKPVFFILGSRV